jgi:hypothetical protein
VGDRKQPPEESGRRIRGETSEEMHVDAGADHVAVRADKKRTRRPAPELAEGVFERGQEGVIEEVERWCGQRQDGQFAFVLDAGARGTGIHMPSLSGHRRPVRKRSRFSAEGLVESGVMAVVSKDRLGELAGRHLGFSGWREMAQERVDLFVDATD